MSNPRPRKAITVARYDPRTARERDDLVRAIAWAMEEHERRERSEG